MFDWQHKQKFDDRLKHHRLHDKCIALYILADHILQDVERYLNVVFV